MGRTFGGGAGAPFGARRVWRNVVRRAVRDARSEARTQGAFVPPRYGRDRGRRIGASSALRAAQAIFRQTLLGALGAPAAEHEAADGEAESERADPERADGERLPPRGEPLPAAERLLLLGRQGLAATLLAHRTSCANAEVQVVEDLG